MNLLWIITKLKTDGLFLILKTGFPLKITYGYVSTGDCHNLHDKYVFFVNFRKKCDFFFSRALLCFSRVEIFIFFTPTIFCFHGRDLAENFTGTFKFSRAVFKTFSREGSLFHGRKSKNFHGRKKIFHGKKKHCLWVG